MTNFDLMRHIIRDAGGCLTPTQQLVLIHLVDRAGKDMTCFPSQELLAQQTGFSDRGIRKALKVLTEENIITLIKSGKGKSRSNLYRLNANNCFKTNTTDSPADSANRNEVPILDSLAGKAEGQNEDTKPERGAGDTGTRFLPYRNEVPVRPERGSYKEIHEEIHEEIQEEIHEEMGAEERGAVSDISKGNSLSAATNNNPFFEISDEWQPKEEFLFEEQQRLDLNIFPIDKETYNSALEEFISYRRANDKRRRKDKDWSRLFVKSLVYHVG